MFGTLGDRKSNAINTTCSMNRCNEREKLYTHAGAMNRATTNIKDAFFNNVNMYHAPLLSHTHYYRRTRALRKDTKS